MKSDPVVCRDTLLNYSLDPDRLPTHIAVIMDGNGRWAKKKLMNRVKGHEKGAETVRSIVTISREIGIKFLTLYAFSTENWARPKTEVAALMSLLKKFIKSERETFAENEIRLNIIGQKNRLPENVVKEIDITMDQTRNNDKMVLNLALSYGGREEITRAAREMAKKAAEKTISWEDVTEEALTAHLYTKDIPDPDILIRTSGEMRLSNFLLWQAAYAEIFVTDTLWPDFSQQEFLTIIRDYQSRERRFGKVACYSSDGLQQ